MTDKPIPVRPTNEFTVTRLIPVPILDEDGKKVVGKYMLRPANILVTAWNSACASAAADEKQVNTREKIWGAQGSAPFRSEGKGDWKLIDLPEGTKPLLIK